MSLGAVVLNHARAGKLLKDASGKVVGFDLQLHDCELIDLPFYDAEKKIPRGLEVAEV